MAGKPRSEKDKIGEPMAARLMLPGMSLEVFSNEYPR